MQPVITETMRKRGFLPASDPLTGFPEGSPFSVLDELGHDLPSLLLDPACRGYLEEQRIPAWTEPPATADQLAQLNLYYLRLGFIASGYVNQVGQPATHRLPANIAVPLVQACHLLHRPPILSYDGYALHNWKRFRADGPIALGNIDTLQNFVHLYDEHWFILVHVEIEVLAAGLLSALADIDSALPVKDTATINTSLKTITATLRQQIAVLKRIPEQMAPELYFRTFRPYIRFFEQVQYEGVAMPSVSFRGETGAQSSIMPLLVALTKIPHKRSTLTDHLNDMRNYMPAAHRALLSAVENMPDLRDCVEPATYNELLETMAEFRQIHLGWAQQYIEKWVDDPRGTGGTPYMRWLQQLIDETLAARLGPAH